MLTNILFDLDGTLTDPRLGLIRSVLYALERMGRQAPGAEELDWIIGPPIQHSLKRILGTNDDAEAAECLRLFRERYTDIGLFENEPYEGIREALGELKTRGHVLFVATGKPKPFADRILERFQLAEYFSGIYGSRLDGTRIEKHEVIEDLIEAESIDPENSLMVGDREHDVLGARRNGIACVGVLYGYGSQEELVSAGAIALCSTPQELPYIISSALP